MVSWSLSQYYEMLPCFNTNAIILSCTEVKSGSVATSALRYATSGANSFEHNFLEQFEVETMGP